MSANVEPEEAEAIRDALDVEGRSEVEVHDRDFRTPRRLSAPALEKVTRAIQSVLTAVEVELSDVLGEKAPLELASVGETTANGLFSESEGPFAAIRFDVAGQPGWVVWETLAALRSVEKVLGSAAAVKESRRFSAVESTVFESLLACAADGVLRALEVEAGGLRVAQTREALGDWREPGDDADPHRLHVELSLDGPSEPSTINLYIPVSIEDDGNEASGPERVELPDHLQSVEIQTSVRLPGCDVSLDELLALEEGDVIPLDGRIGDLAHICVDGRVLGQGTLGTRGGHLAIRIEQLLVEEQDSE